MVFLKNNETEYTGLPDKELVASILSEKNREVQRRMQEELYDRYADKVFYKCITFVKDSETAKYLAHDILVKMFLKLQDYKGISPFYGYLPLLTIIVSVICKCKKEWCWKISMLVNST